MVHAGLGVKIGGKSDVGRFELGLSLPDVAFVEAGKADASVEDSARARSPQIVSSPALVDPRQPANVQAGPRFNRPIRSVLERVIPIPTPKEAMPVRDVVVVAIHDGVDIPVLPQAAWDKVVVETFR